MTLFMLHSIGLGNSYLRVFTSFPVGNIVPLKLEVVFPSVKLGNSASIPTSNSEIRVGKYEFPSPVERSISHDDSMHKHCPCYYYYCETTVSLATYNNQIHRPRQIT